MHLVLHLLRLVRALATERTRLALENLALRQQLTVLQRSVERPKLNDGDRMFWSMACEFLENWKEHLVIVKPETVLRWHRRGFRYYWRWKSRSKPGRPKLDAQVVALIRRMSKENPLWGAPRIRDELALLGHEVAESTVAKYMIKTPDPKRQQTWRTFLRNHLDVSAGCDFFTVPTLCFKLLYVFVVLSHDRRRILHVNVTKHPTAEWTAQQLTEAFPGDESIPRFLHRDRDSIYGDIVRQRIAALGMTEVVSAKQAPWQNPYAERVIGSIRRECTDHLVPLNEAHLREILNEYAAYYNRARCHQALEGDAPEPRQIENGDGPVYAVPHVGGLHHHYRRAG
jgi:transposase InsO family protein